MDVLVLFDFKERLEVGKISKRKTAMKRRKERKKENKERKTARGGF